ncbi:zinc finger protein [Aphelenchoides avenae]|nr:zinc finger protein [Aphelenchus avenae]
MNKVLFQWVDGGILKQFQLEKDTDLYRILMAVVNEIKRSLEGNADVPAQAIHSSNQVHGQQADRSSPPHAVSSLSASINVPARETRPVPRAPREQQARSEAPTKVRTLGRKAAGTRQWAFCNNCRTNGKSENIYGTRFKCAVCDSFDLCEACEASGVHAHHVMLRIGVIVQDAISWSRTWKPLHSELKKFCEKLTSAPLNPSEGNPDNGFCNACSLQLNGSHLKCTVCDDFDLCSACDKKSMHDHHVMMRFSKAVHGVSDWRSMEGRLHVHLLDFHDYVIAAKGRQRVRPFDSDVSNASSASASKETRLKKGLNFDVDFDFILDFDFDFDVEVEVEVEVFLDRRRSRGRSRRHS